MKHLVDLGIRWEVKLVSNGAYHSEYLKWTHESLGQLRGTSAPHKDLTIGLQTEENPVTDAEAAVGMVVVHLRANPELRPIEILTEGLKYQFLVI